MKIAADWVVLNEAQFIEESVEALMPHVDYGVVVDTGSTDGTREKVLNLMKKYEHLELVLCDIGDKHEIIKARNIGLETCQETVGDAFWYVVLAGDEIYRPGVAAMHRVLGEVPENIRWIYTWAQTWIAAPDDRDLAVTTPPDPIRPTIFRFIEGMRWEGLHGLEHIVYPDTGPVPADNAAAGFDERFGLCSDAHKKALAYDHMTWLRSAERAELREEIGHKIYGHDWKDAYKNWKPIRFERRP